MSDYEAWRETEEGKRMLEAYKIEERQKQREIERRTELNTALSNGLKYSEVGAFIKGQK